jgi:hypothetical protein
MRAGVRPIPSAWMRVTRVKVRIPATLPRVMAVRFSRRQAARSSTASSIGVWSSGHSMNQVWDISRSSPKCDNHPPDRFDNGPSHNICLLVPPKSEYGPLCLAKLSVGVVISRHVARDLGRPIARTYEQTDLSQWFTHCGRQRLHDVRECDAQIHLGARRR